MSLKFGRAARTLPSPTSNTLPSASPFECPRFDALVFRDGARANVDAVHNKGRGLAGRVGPDFTQMLQFSLFFCKSSTKTQMKYIYTYKCVCVCKNPMEKHCYINDLAYIILKLPECTTLRIHIPENLHQLPRHDTVSVG